MTVSSDLLVDAKIEVLLSVRGKAARVRGGNVVWTRTSRGRTALRIWSEVPSGGKTTIKATGR